MFRFRYLGRDYTVRLSSGAPVVSPEDPVVQLHVEDVDRRKTSGQYYPHPDGREFDLSEALGGDFVLKKRRGRGPPGRVY